jgi:UDPglucose 6-dehydrogenase/GDP-mannose 6-dehydrogenase
MRVAIAGMGYVGLVTGICLAEKGHEVVCADLDESKVRTVKSGAAPIFEAGLAELLERHLGERFDATTSLRDAVLGADLTMIAVGTPFDGREIDLGAVRAAAREIGEALPEAGRYSVVVVKSTVVPGSTMKVVLPLLEEASGLRAGTDFGVGVNPEFLTEGQAVADFMHPDRIVLGGIDERTLDVMEELYAGFPGVPRVRTAPSTAEMIKYASNALLATMISFSNELANLCQAVGDVDIVDVMRGLHSSHYLTVDGKAAPITAFLEAGCGFGGSCLPKDVSALIAHGERAGRPMPLLRAVIEINRERADEVVAILRRRVPSLAGSRIAVLGLAFKPDTDDTRESPAIPIVERLLAEGAGVVVHDPVVRELPHALEGLPVELQPDLGLALCGAEAAVLVTRWNLYEDELPGKLAEADPPPVLVDGRRLLSRSSVTRYDGIGLGAAASDEHARRPEPEPHPAP